MALYVCRLHYLLYYFNWVCFGRLLVEFGYVTTNSLPKFTHCILHRVEIYMKPIKYLQTQRNLLLNFETFVNSPFYEDVL